MMMMKQIFRLDEIKVLVNDVNETFMNILKEKAPGRLLFNM